MMILYVYCLFCDFLCDLMWNGGPDSLFNPSETQSWVGLGLWLLTRLIADTNKDHCVEHEVSPEISFEL